MNNVWLLTVSASGLEIATSCIEKGLALLDSDKDSDPFVEHLGLQSAMPGT